MSRQHTGWSVSAAPSDWLCRSGDSKIKAHLVPWQSSEQADISLKFTGGRVSSLCLPLGAPPPAVNCSVVAALLPAGAVSGRCRLLASLTACTAGWAETN